MSRRPCEPKGSCVPRLQPTKVISAEGTWLYWYCAICGHVVRARRL
jgi:hypothetical protein